MGGGSSKADKADRETKLSEFALQYTNSNMPHLTLYFYDYTGGTIITNTSDMPAALKATGDMCESLQIPMEPAGKVPDVTGQGKSIVLGPFSQQHFKIKNGKQARRTLCIGSHSLMHLNHLAGRWSARTLAR